MRIPNKSMDLAPLLADIESLPLYAGIPQKHYGYYRAFSKRFPYAIYYDLNEEIIQVVAPQHSVSG